MAAQDKIVAGVLVTQSLVGIAWTWSIASALGFPETFLVTNLALAVVGLVSGVGCFRGMRWAAYLGLVFFGIQVLQVVTPTFQFSFTLGFNATMSAGWFDFGKIGVNLFALVLLIWLAIRLGKPEGAFNRERLTRVA
jgi:uncharacterized membrane protein (DUF2068 family)